MARKPRVTRLVKRFPIHKGDARQVQEPFL